MTPPVRVLVATRNPGKVRELVELLGNQLDLVLPASAGIAMPAVREDGNTYAANALLKARALAQAGGGWALADDSGLEVDALDGAPGTRSARFAGEGAGDRENIRFLLEALGNAARRTARFRCVLALAHPGGREITAEGTLEGAIATTPRGGNGFGYDPVFVPCGESRTVAEMEPGEKGAISHRAAAARALAEKLGKGGLAAAP